MRKIVPVSSQYLQTKSLTEAICTTALLVCGETPTCIIDHKNAIRKTNSAFDVLVGGGFIGNIQLQRRKPRLRMETDGNDQALTTTFHKLMDGDVSHATCLLKCNKNFWFVSGDALHETMKQKSDCPEDLVIGMPPRFLVRFMTLSGNIKINSKMPIIERLFGLTPAETRLCGALLEETSLSDAAAKTGIKVSTARSQLKSIFEKIGVRSQSALTAQLTLIMVRAEHMKIDFLSQGWKQR